MVRKVKLDLLEIDDQQQLITTDHDVLPSEPAEAAPAFASGWRRFSKHLLIGSVLFFLVSIGITIWFQFGTKPEKPNVVTASRPAHGDSRLEQFLNFAIDLKDAHDQYKVLLCDVVIELQPGAKLSREDTDIRRAIYKTLHAKSIEALTVAKGKKAIKRELETELDQTLGGKTVKQVYFTRFTLM